MKTKIKKFMYTFLLTFLFLTTVFATTTYAKPKFPNKSVTIKAGKTKSGKLKGLSKTQKRKNWKFTASSSLIKIKRVGKYGYKITTSKKKVGTTTVTAKQGSTKITMTVVVKKSSAKGSSSTTTPIPSYPPNITHENGFAQDGSDELWYGNKYIPRNDMAGTRNAILAIYPEFFGLYKTKYADRCTSTMAKVLSIQQFLNDIGFQYNANAHFLPLAQAIKTKQGVCSDISEIVQLLCYTINIPAELITSYQADHQWNQIYIDGKWLQIDFVTRFATSNTTTPADAIISGFFTNTIAKSGFNITLNGYTFDLNTCPWNAMGVQQSGTNKWNKIYISPTDTNVLLEYMNKYGTQPILDFSSSYPATVGK